MNIKTKADLEQATRDALAGIIEGRVMSNRNCRENYPIISRENQAANPGLFQCQTCEGGGMLKIETGALKNAVSETLIEKLPDILLPCPVCAGGGVILPLSTGVWREAIYQVMPA